MFDREERLVGVVSLTDIPRQAPHRLEAVARDPPLSVTISPGAEILK